MNKVTIDICGKQVPVIFNLGTLLSFEEIAGKSFFGEDFSHIRERVALVLAAIISADPETTIKFEDIVSSDTFTAFNDAFTKVSGLSTEFFDLPKVVAEAEQKEAAESDEAEKN